MEAFIGTIILFAGNYPPSGWLFCNGQVMDISANMALFSILGVQYGGDGVKTYKLPDLKTQSLNADSAAQQTMQFIICTSGIYPPRA